MGGRGEDGGKKAKGNTHLSLPVFNSFFNGRKEQSLLVGIQASGRKYAASFYVRLKE
jgi:hypothetical protein